MVPFAVIFTCLGLVTFADAGRNVDDYRSDALLTSDELKKVELTTVLHSHTIICVQSNMFLLNAKVSGEGEYNCI